VRSRTSRGPRSRQAAKQHARLRQLILHCALHTDNTLLRARALVSIAAAGRTLTCYGGFCRDCASVPELAPLRLISPGPCIPHQPCSHPVLHLPLLLAQ
jgi:hypothetical protein